MLLLPRSLDGGALLAFTAWPALHVLASLDGSFTVLVLHGLGLERLVLAACVCRASVLTLLSCLCAAFPITTDNLTTTPPGDSTPPVGAQAHPCEQMPAGHGNCVVEETPLLCIWPGSLVRRR